MADEPNHHFLALDRRVGDLESWRATQETQLAVREERDKHLDKRFDRLEEGVAEVKGYLLRIVWVVILAIVGSLMTFIISGGLSLVGN